ncbi:MAG: polysaccharide biosynthesis tyrosine autokinase [Sedimentisphaerales bacterium]|nr:polysaccharide biosynthesis tyrosine autokinase [Sedimentisphaerales bacterium]
MNNLEKYLDQVIEQKPVVYDAPATPEPPAQPSVMAAARRRWYILVLVALVICALAVPATWLWVKPRYVVTGTIRVAAVQPSILTGEQERGEIGDYDSYMNTQAALIVNPDMLQRVADELHPRKLSFFEVDSNDPLIRLGRWFNVTPRSRDAVEILRKAITKGTIAVAPIRRTELLGVTVKSGNEGDARLMIESLIRNFVAMYDDSSSTQTSRTLDSLRVQEEALLRTIQQEQREMNQVHANYGTTELNSQQQLEMQRVSTLQAEAARLEARRMGLEASVAALEQAGDVNTPAEQVVAARKEYVNADSMVRELTRSIVELKRDMLISKQRLAPENPELVRQQQLLATFEENLKQKENDLTQEFEAQVAARATSTSKQRIAALRAELDQISRYEERLKKALDTQETRTRKVGQDSVGLQEVAFNLGVNQQLHDQILRRINDITMERNRARRVQPWGTPQIASIEDKRPKYTAVIVLLALACGFGLAVLRDRVDKTLRSPDDLARQLDLPVIGTTTSSRTLKAAQFAEHLAGDYQTIRTNLSLLNAGGMPKKLSVSSAGTREGKTTFAVNLATSLAKSGKKVLLIDGDLRKPDIGYMLGILNGSAGLQDVLLGGNTKDAVHVVPSSGLHVIVANARHLADPYELLTSTTAAEQLEKLSRQYDHLIVDTPPALAFPDALVWARLTDAVVLISFAGQTTAPDLKETRERFARIRTHVLGAVLSNVPVYQSLYRSSYSYRPIGSQAKHKARKARRLLLLAHSDETGARMRPNVDTDSQEM